MSFASLDGLVFVGLCTWGKKSSDEGNEIALPNCGGALFKRSNLLSIAA